MMSATSFYRNQRVTVLVLFLLLGLLITSTPLPALAAPTTYYVATSGSDSNPGTLAAPLQTIQRAAELAQAGDTVLVREGVYRETVRPSNGGLPGAPITFAAYPGEQVTISGADLLSGPWATGANGTFSLNDVAGFSSSIRQAEQLFVDGQMLNLARFPNSTLDVSRPGRSTIAAILANDGGSPLRTITMSDPSLSQPANYWVGAQIWVTPDLAYQAVSGEVLASQPGQLTFRYNAETADSGSQGDPVMGSPYALFNTLAALDAPGEWYRDPGNNTLYLRTIEGGDPANQRIEFKRRDYAFDLSERSNITVRGFRIFAATITTDNEAGGGDGGVRQESIAPANNIVIERIRARYLSHFTDQSAFVYTQWSNNTGIVLSGSNHQLRDSVLEYSAGNGVSLLGTGSKVLNNIIRDVAYSACECAAINTGFVNTISQDHEIGHNTAYTSGKNLVLFRNLENSDPATPRARIHHNDFSNGALLTADTGILYTWSNTTPGRDLGGLEIDHNLLHDNYNKSASPAIYLDGTISNMRIHHNVSWNSGGIVTGGVNNLIYNNTFSGPTGAPGSNNPDNQGTILRNNIFGGRISFASPTWTLENNLEYTTDPLFCAAPRANFALQEASPARDSGLILPPYTDGYQGTAPDIGAYEFNPARPCKPDWQAGASLNLPTPPAPTNLQGSFNLDRVDLSWVNRSDEQQSVVVERSEDGVNWQAIATLSGSTKRYSDVGLYPANYLYRVRADGSPYSVVTAINGGRSALGRIQAITYDAFGGGDNSINPFGPVGGYDHGNWLKYADMALPPDLSEFSANIQTFVGTQARIEVWVDALPTYAGGPGGGFKLTELDLRGRPLYDFGPFENFATPVIAGYPTGKHDLYLLAAPVENGDGDIGNLQSFQFSSNAAPLLAPGYPAAINIGHRQIDLLWDDLNSDELGTIIERSSDGLVFYEIGRVGSDRTRYRDRQLRIGTTYSYRLRSYRQGAVSPRSAVASATAARQPTPVLIATPNELQFSAYSGGSDPAAQIVRLRAGNMPIRYQLSVTGGEGWLQVTGGNGRVKPGEAQTITVQAGAGTLAVGSYSATILFQSLEPGVPSASVLVRYYVLPALSATPTSLAFSAYSGQQNPAPLELTLSSVDGSIPWTATISPTVEWLSLDTTSGEVSPGTAATITAHATLGSLAPGLYTTNLVIADGRIPTNQIVIGVQFQVKAVRDAYSDIQAASADASSGVNIFCCGVGGLDKEDWLRYDGVDFGAAPGAQSVSLTIGVPDDNAGGQIELRLDSLDGPIVGVVDLAGTGGYGGGGPLFGTITGASGIHDLYMIVRQGSNPFGYGLANFYAFQFSTEELAPPRDAYSLIQAASADTSEGVNIFCCGVGSLDKEDWLRYRRVDFGAGAASVTVAVGVPDDNAGGQIELRLDSLDGPIIGVLDLTATGGYGSGADLSTAISGASGIHDLYLVVRQGSNPFGYGLAQLYNFQFTALP
jgi:hypothetical protein